jgi:two-component system nitrogen regulation sensor histidine kinase NtrY
MMSVPIVMKFVEPGQLVFTMLVILLVLVAQTIELYYYLNRTLRELIQFLEHIKNRDFNIRFNEKDSKGARKNLYRTFNDVLEVYREIRIEKEVHFRFLEHIVELIDIGIIVFDEGNRVVMSNTAASSLTGIAMLKTWEHMVEKSPELGASVGTIGESRRVLFESGASTRLAIQVSRTRMLEESYSLVTIQDINSVVEQKETGAWIRLLRTLNHEIKNSVTPISSLADTLVMILQNDDGRYKSRDELQAQNMDDIIKSVETLQQRSKSLHGFIDEYHKLTRIPAPDARLVSCIILLRETTDLFQSELKSAGVRLKLDDKTPGPEINADHALIGQVLVNLIRNSMDALEGHEDPEITLTCEEHSKETTICVCDNGSGIEQELLEDIFIPFFTTKTNGSGIGLSLVRQIMRLHGGEVRISSQKGKGTTVCLIFPVRSAPPVNLV